MQPDYNEAQRMLNTENHGMRLLCFVSALFLLDPWALTATIIQTISKVPKSDTNLAGFLHPLQFQ